MPTPRPRSERLVAAALTVPWAACAGGWAACSAVLLPLTGHPTRHYPTPQEEPVKRHPLLTPLTVALLPVAAAVALAEELLHTPVPATPVIDGVGPWIADPIEVLPCVSCR